MFYFKAGAAHVDVFYKTKSRKTLDNREVESPSGNGLTATSIIECLTIAMALSSAMKPGSFLCIHFSSDTMERAEFLAGMNHTAWSVVDNTEIPLSRWEGHKNSSSKFIQ